MPVRGRNAGNKGQGSNWASKAKRHRIYSRDGWHCLWCECRVALHGSAEAVAWHRAAATLDHVIPRESGGTNAPHNLITACMRCNRERGAMTVLQYAARQATRRDRTFATVAGILWRILQATERPLPPAPAAQVAA